MKNGAISMDAAMLQKRDTAAGHIALSVADVPLVGLPACGFVNRSNTPPWSIGHRLV